MADRFVLDSFALLALFQHEPGGLRVQELLVNAGAGSAELLMSVVNLGESVYTTEVRRGRQAAEMIVAAVDQLPIELAPVDRVLALAAARVKATTRMGYADCFAAALARAAGATVVTGDADFRRVEGWVPIDWLAP